MSLPPGFLDELRSRLSLGQVVGKRVTWDLRKSNQAKGDLWAPCPFHEEKTASFHVDDRKGFYYCFGCQAKGDAIAFLRQIDNMSFAEAVEALAREAGLAMPARDPQAKARSDRQTRLAEVMELAVRHFRLALATRAGAEARAYLDGRGLRPETLERFEIGYAPPDRLGVLRHLAEKGVAEDLIVDAGLCARPDDGGAPYDRFRDRIVFPIRDARGRAIALGGRAMDPKARAKYLNSPETDLFDKGRTLYNLGPAREAAGKGGPLVLAEGYMDVIAMVQAGFAAAVAPLGTAVTEAQLQALWRVDSEPVVALDGDKAGLRAAMRLVDLALPHLEPGRTLRFALLPEGQDPDDLIRAQGAEAMRAALDAALPLSGMLWRRETEAAAPLDTPERRAALDRSLREALRAIRDPSVRRHYGDEMARRRAELFGVPPPSGARRDWEPRRGAPPSRARASTRASALGSAGAAEARLREGIVLAQQLDEETPQRRLREEVVLAVVLLHPALLDEFEEALETVEWSGSTAALARAVLAHRADRAACEAALGTAALETVLVQSQIVPTLRPSGDRDAARAVLEGDLAKLTAAQGVRREVWEAVQDLEALVGETGTSAEENVTWRLGQAAAALERAERVLSEDREAFETADNGLALSRDERARAQALFGGIDFGRGGRPPRRRGGAA